MNTIKSQIERISAQLGVNKGNISQSFLRAETLLDSSSNIAFNLLEKGNNSNIASQRLLKPNDGFIATHWTIALKKVAATSPSQAQHITSILHQYVNPSVFDGTSSSLNEAVALQAIYQAGKMKLSIDKVEFMPGVPVRDFERVHTAQQGQVMVGYVDVAGTGDTTYTTPRSERVNGLDGYYDIPFIGFNGNQDVNPSIDLGASVDMTETNESNYAVLIVKGYQISNVGNALDAWN